MKGFGLLVVLCALSLTGCQIRNSSDGLELELKAPLASPQKNGFDFSKGKFSFADLKNSSLQSCTKCHSKSQEPYMNTLQDWRDNQVSVLDEIEMKSMPPEDEGFTSLNSCEIALVKRWYELGAPENSDEPFDSVEECKNMKSKQ